MPDQQSVTPSTFRFERRYPVTAARIFAAFAEKSEKRRWYVENSQMVAEEFEMDFRVGGRDVLRYRFGDNSPFPGVPLTFNTTYLDIVPARRLVYAYSLSMGDAIVSSSLVTFEFLPSDGATDVLFTEQGAYCEGSGGAEMRKEGWRTLLDRLDRHFAG